MKRFATLFLASVLSIALGGSAFASSICTECEVAYDLFVDNEPVGQGVLPVNADGRVSLERPLVIEGPDYTIVLDVLEGDVDPSLIFAGSALNNSAAPKTYSFAFSLPINLNGLINSTASVSYSLTDGNNNSATLFPTSGTGFVVDSQDINTTTFVSTDKGVDVGDACTVGPPTGAYTCGPYNRASTFGSAGQQFDLMSVIVAFGLTPGDAAGVSGVVTQELVPEPGTLLLLGSGLVGLFTFSRRSA